MEDVKEQFVADTTYVYTKPVSILVLMEDVKELTGRLERPRRQLSFNPCFNGRCKRTKFTPL